MPTYIVEIQRTTYEVVDAKDEAHALRRGLAIASAGRNPEEFRAVRADRAEKPSNQ